MSFATAVIWRMTVLGLCAVAGAVWAVPAAAQRGAAPPSAAPAAASQPEPWTDPLGRSTPRGTVRGFIDAGLAGDYARAAQYLNTRRRDAADLANKLFVVLDARLPARQMRITDQPEGSDPSTPDVETIGTVVGNSGSAPVVLERVKRASEQGPVWLFSQETIDAVVGLHGEITTSRWSGLVPEFLLSNRVGGLRLVDIFSILLGLPLLYVATVLLNRAVTPLIGMGFRTAGSARPSVLPGSARLLLVIVAGRWLMTTLPISLAARQLWTSLTVLIVIGTVARLLMLLNGEAERYILERVAASHQGASSLLRLLRRGADLLIIFAAVIAVLFQFGIDPTPALAGLGVGGIAVALAAQKTLENVIAGASIIFDKAVHVGDFLKMGEVQGTVEHIGLRSTRIRTLDRTLVSVPNGQIANVSLETFSARDKFWFHPAVGLVYDTRPEQIREVVDGIRRMLLEHPLVDIPSVRVRFFQLGASSLDIDVFAYLQARDWNHFLEIQEQLLFSITEIVSRAGTSIAFPSQTMYLAGGGDSSYLGGSAGASLGASKLPPSAR
jgi:MscS family membrane protein